MSTEIKHLIRKQKRGLALTPEEQAYYDATMAEMSLWLLAVQVHKSFRVPSPAVAIPREGALMWCLIPTPTVEVERVKVQRRRSHTIHICHTSVARLTPEARRGWAAMRRKRTRIEVATAQGQPVSRDDLVFSRLAGLAEQWAEWERRFERKKPAVPPVIVVPTEEAPAWVLAPPGPVVNIVVVHRPPAWIPR